MGGITADLARNAPETRHVDTPTSSAKSATGTDTTDVKSDNVQQEIEQVVRYTNESYAEIPAMNPGPVTVQGHEQGRV